MITDGAVGGSQSGHKKTKVVEDFGNGTDGRARISVNRFLVNTYCWRKPSELIDFRARHLSEKLSSIGG